MKRNLAENNLQQIAGRPCNHRSFSGHTRLQYEFAGLYFRKTDLIFDSLPFCIVFYYPAQSGRR